MCGLPLLAKTDNGNWLFCPKRKQNKVQLHETMAKMLESTVILVGLEPKGALRMPRLWDPRSLGWGPGGGAGKSLPHGLS